MTSEPPRTGESAALVTGATGAPHPARDLAGLLGGLERVGRLLELPDERLHARAPQHSAWSAAEHVFHLVLALDLSLRNVKALVRDKGRLVREAEDRQPDSLATLLHGRIPRGTAEAPRFARPPERFELSLVRELFAEAQAVAQELAADRAALEAAPRTIPHQIIGDLYATEWVRFGRVHTTHHLLIAREVLAATAG